MPHSPFGSPEPDRPEGVVPEWAKIRADFPEDTVDAVDEVWESVDTASQKKSHQKPHTPRRGFGFPQIGKKPQQSSRTVTDDSVAVEDTMRRRRGVRRRLAGGRWQVIGLRILTWSVLLVLVVLGVWRIADPVPISPESIVSDVEQRLDITDFPQRSGQALADRYVRAYFTYDRTNTNQALEEFFATEQLPRDFIPVVGGDVIEVAMVTDPVLLAPPVLASDTQGVYTFLVQVRTIQEFTQGAGRDPRVETSTQWHQVNVPVASSADGAVSLQGPLSLMPLPAGTQVSRPTAGEVDEKASTDAQEYLDLYFQQWAAASVGDPVSSAYLIAGRSTPAARYGLSGQVELETVRSLSVYLPSSPVEANPATRDASAVVVWSDPQTGMRLVNSYDLSLLMRDDYWYVLDIRGGALQD